MLSRSELMLNEQTIRALLGRVAAGEQDVDEALDSLRVLPFEDLTFAKIDHHRALRRGHPEVIYCAGKTPAQVAEIAARMAARSPRVLGTRATPEQFEVARQRLPELRYD